MKAAIVIDSWKLSTFDHHLKAAGFTYEKNPGVTEDTITLVVIHGNPGFACKNR